MNNAKQIPEYFGKSVIYQMFLRPFTLEGTLRSAEKLLPFLAKLEFDIVYLCPIADADDDMDKAHWSDRQNKSALDNPKNPYRIKDYFTVDSEYGTDDDLRHFVATAHSLGLRVMLDLVYLHCGPGAVFLSEHPDYVQRDENGIVFGQWHFPLLNFESAGLREYLWKNMTYFAEEFQVDGYRCDVGDGVPLDFWREGVRRVRALKPDFVMLNEGTNGEYLEDVFDANYCFKWSYELSDVLRGKLPASALHALWEATDSINPPGGRVLRCLDNHDTASDSYNDRIECSVGSDGMEAALFLLYTMDGIPMIYNGNEICDTRRHSIFGNRFFGKDLVIDWSGAVTPQGLRRQEFITSMNRLRHSDGAIHSGETQWLESSAPDKLAAFTRRTSGKTALCLLNLSKEALSAKITLPGGLPGSAVAVTSRGAEYTSASEGVSLNAAPYGYTLIEY